ncbi:hypothetical protein GCM10025868_43170 [Angustibacter aerolatus]|uniref:Uncharacterized protein n=1 Tax=Angustibacter aerolatus TaxID=1162965 RepID=A0ABQ6JLB9_9ACTN|nr:hypothetical protein GCM10025868_43170 [Angustibacter aerolatus]
MSLASTRLDAAQRLAGGGQARQRDVRQLGQREPAATERGRVAGAEHGQRAGPAVVAAEAARGDDDATRAGGHGGAQQLPTPALEAVVG